MRPPLHPIAPAQAFTGPVAAAPRQAVPFSAAEPYASPFGAAPRHALPFAAAFYFFVFFS